MHETQNISVSFIQNIDLAVWVMRDAGAWLLSSGKHTSEYWQMDRLNKEYLLQHAEPEEFYVGLIDNKPAVACLLQETERNQSWKSVDGKNSKSALYIHWLCVSRIFSGRNLPRVLVDFSLKQAQARRIPLLRLDTETNNAKLQDIYEKIGFQRMGEADGAVYYQLRVDVQ